MSKWFQISGRFRRMIRPFTAVHLCYIMPSLSVNLMGWAPQKIKCCWGLTPFYFQICLIFYFLKGVLPPHSLEVHHTRMILLVNCRELCNSCNQQLQPTAWQLGPISRYIASMKDQDGSGTSAYTGWKKNSTNIEIYEKPIRAVSWWASIITSPQ